MRFLFLRILPLLALLYALLCVGIYLGQRRLLYFPGGAQNRDPSHSGLDYDEIVISTEDGQSLEAWLIRPLASAESNLEKRAVVLVSHGNAGNISGRLHIARAFAEMGLHVLLYDYRGYGASTGSPTEAGLYADAQATYEHLLKAQRFRPEEIFLYGESLGGGPTVELAHRHTCAGVILDKTFTSAVDVAKGFYRWLPVDLLMRDRFENLAKISDVNAPLLVIHSAGDELIDVSHGRAILAAANEPKEFVETRGGHNDIGFAADESALARIRAFVERSLLP